MKNRTFEEKVVRATMFAQKGDPIKDVLDEWEINEAINRLGDVYVALGIVKVSEVDK